MTPDKNTLNMSNVNELVRSFIQSKENYHLGILGKVEPVGIHDEVPLQILIYRGGVVLEQLRRLNDDEENDIIVSTCFNFDEVPERWPMERYMDAYDYLNCKEFQSVVSTFKFKKSIDMFVE